MAENFALDPFHDEPAPWYRDIPGAPDRPDPWMAEDRDYSPAEFRERLNAIAAWARFVGTCSALERSVEAGDPGSPIQLELSHDPDPRVRRQLATNPALEPAIGRALSFDPDYLVRLNLVQNPAYAPAEIQIRTVDSDGNEAVSQSPIATATKAASQGQDGPDLSL